MTIREIHQIEITSICNLRCKYCVWPKMPRAKEHMTEETWQRSLYWVKRFSNAGTQGELNLCGIGESTLHPDLCRWIREARDAVGQNRRLIMATNGIAMTEEHAATMKECNFVLWISLHRPEKATNAVNLMRQYKLEGGVSMDPAISSVDWAGQVQWPVTTEPSPCPWIPNGWSFVLSDGRVGTCCFDGSGTEGVLGTVHDDVSAMKSQKYSLCESCHHYVD